MNSIQELFQQAQLAEAAYADFSVPGVGLKDALISEGMSEPQATEFTNNWREVDQYTATGWIGQTWTGTGFSATLFQNKNTNAYTLAIRGSTGVNDFLADAQLIATDGVAF
ncbi:MAG TPA: hypothetical protein PLI90_13345, partial [Rhodocyclaceae bacterium]|nr:hypothetical protein [Rhodocyclaceae bacterium]